MKKAVFLRESLKIILTKNLIIIGVPSREKQGEFLRMTKTPNYIELMKKFQK